MNHITYRKRWSRQDSVHRSENKCVQLLDQKHFRSLWRARFGHEHAIVAGYLNGIDNKQHVHLTGALLAEAG